MSARKALEDYLKEVDYTFLNDGYIPSQEALEFLAFIKLVNGVQGEQNKTPAMHLKIIEDIVNFNDVLAVIFRGAGKTAVCHEYMYLFLAVYGYWFNFGIVEVGMYVSDTMDNGVKSMRTNLEHRWLNSEFLQKYVPKAKFTDDAWEFTNVEGKKLFIKGFGASTGVRGFKRYGKRPVWCGLDDLMSDKNSKSPTITQDISDIIYSAARQAMDPQARKIVWTGTPFNKKDPLYQAASTSMWKVAAFPVCEKFPCEESEFVGAWEDRFSYKFIKKEYEALLDAGKINSFNQELMLRISSEEDRLIQDEDIQWYSRNTLLLNKSSYNFYITTDFATKEKESADYSVISVWAVNNKGYYFLVDGICKRQTMDKNVDDLFRLVQEYQPQSVGVEVSGQQEGFISFIQRRQLETNIWFSLASDKNGGSSGIRPNTNKLQRFQIVVPWFKAKIVFFPEEWRTNHPWVIQAVDELSFVTAMGFKSAHDDVSDTISMLSVMNIWKPTHEVTMKKQGDVWEDEYEEEYSAVQGYIV